MKDDTMVSQEALLAEIVRKEEFGRSTKATPVTASYLKSLSSTLMDFLYNKQDIDHPFLRKHMSSRLREQFDSDDDTWGPYANAKSVPSLARVNMEMVDILPDVDDSGLKARTWCLKSDRGRGSNNGLSHESMALLYWELQKHRVWVCVDIRVVSGAVGF